MKNGWINKMREVSKTGLIIAKPVIILILIMMTLKPVYALRIFVFDGQADLAFFINNTNSGDTLLIKKGHYNTADIQINHPLTLIGENGSVIDGSEKGQIITVNSDSVIISGLTFVNTPVSYINDNAAIKLNKVKNCIIDNNTFENNFFAIYLAQSANCKILNNKITGKETRESASANGIHLWYCKEIEIKNNTIEGHRDGIYLEFVENSEISNNVSRHNLRYGLHFMFSDKCEYTANHFFDNGAGVAVMYTKNIIMKNNIFEKNWGSASYGILLKEITDSNIDNNRFIKNSIGIYAESSNRIDVKNNTFEQNGWAVKIMGNCLDNHFRHNNFFANSFDVATNTKHNFNTFNENYWDNYNGYDLDRDNIGDIPYNPVSLFSYMVEQNEPALILMRTFFVDLLNIAERVIPVITPETLRDTKPLMRRIQ